MGVSDPEIQKKCLALDGSMKFRNRAGRSGKSSSIASNIARFASPQSALRKLDE